MTREANLKLKEWRVFQELSSLETDPRDSSPSEFRNKLSKYIERNELDQAIKLVYCRKNGIKEMTTFIIDAIDLMNYDPSLAYTVIHYQKLILPVFEEALRVIQDILIRHPSVIDKYGVGATIKSNTRIRINNLPPMKSLVKHTIGQIRSCEVDSLLQICGTVVRTGPVRMLEMSKRYECMNPKCRYSFQVEADPEQGHMLPQPTVCPGIIRAHNSTLNHGEDDKQCTSRNLREVEGSKQCVDYQEIKLQDHAERLPFGYSPRTMLVMLEGDLVDKFNPGDKVTVVGTIIRQWRSVVQGSRAVVDIVFRANGVFIQDAQDKRRVRTPQMETRFTKYWEGYNQAQRSIAGRNKIVAAVCPQLYGLYFVKLALLLTLIGGGNNNNNNGHSGSSNDNKENSNPTTTSTTTTRNTTPPTAASPFRVRTQSHLLMVGDPGTGKSQLLRFAAALMPRSVTTTGMGTSAAGLTCTAIKDGGDWAVEAGALVLANDGVCIIDEFASVREHDRVSIHEAMEQQTISVAKAGMMVKLNSRCTVVAACNPKGSYDPTIDISANTAISGPLLSRFDLVLVMLDQPHKDYDKRISTFLLRQAVRDGSSGDVDGDCFSDDEIEIGESVWSRFSKNNKNHQKNENMNVMNEVACNPSQSQITQHSQDFFHMQRIESELKWDLNTLRDYVSFVRDRATPALTIAAEILLQRYYQQRRQEVDRQGSRTTVRLLESLMRLSIAHARLMMHHRVEPTDAVAAIHCISTSQAMADGQTNVLSPFGPSDQNHDHSHGLRGDFPPENIAEQEFEREESEVYMKMHFTRDMLAAQLREIGQEDHIKSNTDGVTPKVDNNNGHLHSSSISSTLPPSGSSSKSLTHHPIASTIGLNNNNNIDSHNINILSLTSTHEDTNTTLTNMNNHACTTTTTNNHTDTNAHNDVYISKAPALTSLIGISQKRRVLDDEEDGVW